MTRIREDLVGVVHAHSADERVVILAAGDDVPDGFTVGEHLVESAPASEEIPGGVTYDVMTVADLKADIDRRNEGRADDAKIVPVPPGNKADLVAALVSADADYIGG